MWWINWLLQNAVMSCTHWSSWGFTAATHWHVYAVLFMQTQYLQKQRRHQRHVYIPLLQTDPAAGCIFKTVLWFHRLQVNKKKVPGGETGVWIPNVHDVYGLSVSIVLFCVFFADDQISFPVMMKLNLIGLNCEKLVCVKMLDFKRWFLRTVHHFGKRVDVCRITNIPLKLQPAAG